MVELINKFVNFKYYGSRDYLGGYFLKQVCDNIEYLENNIKSINKHVESIEDVYMFYWCCSFKKMVDDLDNYQINKVIKERIIRLSSELELEEDSFIKYVNNNYFVVFDESKHEDLKWGEFFRCSIELCYGFYSKGIKEAVFNFFEERYPLNILNDFDICSNYYKKHRKGFESLFNGLKDTRLFDDQVYLSFLESTPNKTDKFLIDQATFICNRTLEEVKRKNLTEDSKEILQIQSMFLEYDRLAVSFKLPCANEYSILKKKIQALLDSYVKKHGVQKNIGPIDLKPAIEILKNSKDPYKFINLTHRGNKDGKIENSLNYIFSISNKKNPLSEAFNDISRYRSDKYPYYKQDSMRINLNIRNSIIAYILNDEQLSKEFVDYIYNVSIAVQEKYFDNLINIENEITGELDSFLAIVDLARNDQFESALGKWTIYGASLSICTTIEKILRNVALKEVRNKEYLDISKATLSNLLGSSFELKDLSKGLRYHLEFYMIKELTADIKQFEKPGLNIRNNLMHGQDDVYAITNYETSLTLLYFLVSLINDLIVSTQKDKP